METCPSLLLMLSPPGSIHHLSPFAHGIYFWNVILKAFKKRTFFKKLKYKKVCVFKRFQEKKLPWRNKYFFFFCLILYQSYYLWVWILGIQIYCQQFHHNQEDRLTEQIFHQYFQTPVFFRLCRGRNQKPERSVHVTYTYISSIRAHCCSLLFPFTSCNDMEHSLFSFLFSRWNGPSPCSRCICKR